MNAYEMQLAVSLLHTAYAQTIDDDRLEEWPEFFTDDCLYKVTTFDNHHRGLAAGVVYCDNKGMLKDRVSGLREANIYERHRYRHIVSMPALQPASTSAELRAQTPFAVYRITRNRPSELFVTGCYHDTLVQDGGRLKLRERVVVCDSQVFDTLLAIPL